MGCGCSKPMPGPLTLARNATGAAARVVIAAAQGKPLLVSEAERQARLARCHVCHFCLIVEKNGTTYHRCTHPQCGCWLDGKHARKAALATEKCPEDNWPKTHTEEAR